jgi:hypothetical protein
MIIVLKLLLLPNLIVFLILIFFFALLTIQTEGARALVACGGRPTVPRARAAHCGGK